MTTLPIKSLRGLILLVISGVSIVALAAIAATILLNQQIFNSFERYSEKSLPLLESINRIQSESLYLSEMLSRIHLNETEEDVQATAEALLASLDVISTQLRVRNPIEDPGVQEQLLTKIDTIRSMLNEQYHSMMRYLDLQQQSSHAHTELLNLITRLLNEVDFASIEYEVSASTLPLNAANQSYQTLQELIAIETEAHNLPILIAQAAIASSPTGLNINKDRSLVLIRNISAMALRIDDVALRKKLSRVINLIYREHTQRDKFYDFRTRQLTIRQQAVAKSELIKTKLSDLSEGMNQSFDKVRVAIDGELAKLSQLVTIAVVVTVGLLLSLVVGYFVVYRWVISRLILQPFESATQAIQAISLGKHDYPPFDTRMDELHRMEEALQIFKHNAEELRYREYSLIQTNEALDKTNEKLETFVRVSSHDLKSPLRGIRILSNQVKESLENEDWENVRYNVERIERRVIRLDSLLNSLLSYVRIDKEKWDKNPIDLEPFINEQLELLDQHQLQITVNASVGKVSLHTAPFATVIRNLVDNAIKHHDLPDGKIEIKAFRHESNVIVSISDDGPGIPKEYQKRVFQPFETIKPKDEVEGAGMGLTIIEKLTNEANGNLSLNSPLKEGRGSEFIIVWPLRI